MPVRSRCLIYTGRHGFLMAAREPVAHRFMDLTIPEYAYMFGFLQADGHLSQQSGRRGRLTLEISSRDIDILHAFQGLTPYNSSITQRSRSTNVAETHTSAIWRLCSLEARTTLNALGLPYGRKSKTIAPPRGRFSRRDYVRGIIDADGSVGFTSRDSPSSPSRRPARRSATTSARTSGQVPVTSEP